MENLEELEPDEPKTWFNNMDDKSLSFEFVEFCSTDLCIFPETSFMTFSNLDLSSGESILPSISSSLDASWYSWTAACVSPLFNNKSPFKILTLQNRLGSMLFCSHLRMILSTNLRASSPFIPAACCSSFWISISDIFKLVEVI